MASDGEVWHLVEARRDDGMAAMFRIRDLEPRPDQPRIFVVELPYPITALSRLPDAASYRRLTQFEEQWLSPACTALGWTFVAAKTEDGSFFLYLYGNGDPNELVAKLAPFDGALAFFDEQDPAWAEYGALKELVDQAPTDEDDEDDHAHAHHDHEHHDHDHDHDHTSTALRPVKSARAKPSAKAGATKRRAASPTVAKTPKGKPKPSRKPGATKRTASGRVKRPAAAKATRGGATAKGAKRPAAKAKAKAKTKTASKSRATSRKRA